MIVYTPMLRAKEGDLKALAMLSTKCVRSVQPFVDVVRPTAKGADPIQPVFAVADMCRRFLGHVWKPYVDYFDLLPGEMCEDGSHPITLLHDLLRQKGVESIPVTGLDRETDHIHAVNAIDCKSVCVRLLSSDLIDPFHLRGELLELEDRLEFEDVHIVVDHGSIVGESYERLYARTVECLSVLEPIAKVSRVVVSGSTFPESLSDIPKGEVARLERMEVNLSSALFTSYKGRLKLAHGDYTVMHPQLLNRVIKNRPKPKLRYCGEEEWTIIRAKDGQTYNDLARMLLSSDRNDGELDSWADREFVSISHPSSREIQTPLEWITYDINRHMEKTSEVMNDRLGVHVREEVLERSPSILIESH